MSIVLMKLILLTGKLTIKFDVALPCLLMATGNFEKNIFVVFDALDKIMQASWFKNH